MPSTKPRVFAFDFDGTLVDSAAAKRQAFFDIFAPAHAAAIATVLAAEPDTPRSAVIPMMLAEIRRRGLPPPDREAAALVEDYGRTADVRVATAAEIPGASDLLRTLSRNAPVYVMSATPHDRLLAHLDARGWSEVVAGAFGFPNRKIETVAMLLARHAIPSEALLVVGDGISDREAAEANGCPFHAIGTPEDLLHLNELTATSHV